jgi:hypothetical protein
VEDPLAVRVYADTSVYGGAFDEEFEWGSRAFFDMVRRGRIGLVTSALVDREIRGAPRQVAELFHEMLPHAETVGIEEPALRLHQDYLSARIVSPDFSEDAMHVALAIVSGCSAIVSWNFRHIVNLRKIPLYNAIGAVRGYRPIEIRTPLEVLSHEEEGI